VILLLDKGDDQGAELRIAFVENQLRGGGNTLHVDVEALGFRPKSLPATFQTSNTLRT